MEAKRLTAREKNALKIQSQISNAALELFDKYGYEAVKVTEICEKANVAIGTFYHHYKSKDELLTKYLDIMDSYLDLEGEYMDDLTIPERIRHLMTTRSVLAYELVRKAPSANLFSMTASEPAFSLERPFSRMFIKEFKAGQEQGIFKSDLSEKIILYVAQYITIGMSSQFREETDQAAFYKTVEEVVEAFLKMLSAVE